MTFARLNNRLTSNMTLVWKIKRYLLLSVMLITLSFLQLNCAAIKKARVAQDSTQIPAGERTVTASEVGLDSGSTLSLDRAVRTALAYNPTIVRAQQNVVIADARARSALSYYLPSLSSSINYSYSESEDSYNQNDNSQSIPNINLQDLMGNNQDPNNYSISLNIDQLLFDFGRTSASVRQANLNRLTAQERLRLAQNNAAYQARLAFYDLSKAEALLSVSDEELKQFELTLKNISLLAEVGRLTSFEVTKAEVNVGNAKTNLLNAQNAVKTARANLNQAMGLAEDPGYSIIEPVFEDLSPSFDELMSAALCHNPELSALKSEEEIASAGVDLSIANLFPKLSLSGDLSWRGSKLPLAYSWNLGPMLTLSIFDGLRNINGVDEAAAQLRISRAQKAGKEQQIYVDLSRGLSQLENARQRALVADEVVKKAELNRSQMAERYRVGRATMLELTDTHLALAQAKSEMAQADYDRQSATALINLVSGKEYR